MLRAIEEHDLPYFRDWRNQLQKYFRQYRQLTPYDQAKWFEELLNDPNQFMFSIWYDGQVVGCCGLRVDRQNRSGEISLYIGDPKVEKDPIYIDGKAAPLALKDLMAYAFDTLGLHRVWAEVFDYDDKKKQLLINAKFTTEGSLRETYFKMGSFVDSTILGYLEKEWVSREQNGFMIGS